MVSKLNLAMLNKRREDVADSEMKNVKGCASESDCNCVSPITFSDSFEMHGMNPCSCGSIWVVFGLAWGVAEQ